MTATKTEKREAKRNGSESASADQAGCDEAMFADEAIGVERASKEAIDNSLHYWASTQQTSDDKLIGFLAQMIKKTLTGEIREPRGLPF